VNYHFAKHLPQVTPLVCNPGLPTKYFFSLCARSNQTPSHFKSFPGHFHTTFYVVQVDARISFFSAPFPLKKLIPRRPSSPVCIWRLGALSPPFFRPLVFTFFDYLLGIGRTFPDSPSFFHSFEPLSRAPTSPRDGIRFTPLPIPFFFSAVLLQTTLAGRSRGY